MEEGFLIVLAFIVIVGIFWVVVLDIHKKFNVKNKKWRKIGKKPKENLIQVAYKNAEKEVAVLHIAIVAIL